MKISKFIIVFTIALLSFSTLKASGDPIIQTPKEIQSLLQSSFAKTQGEAKIYITFMLNNDNEIVVMSTSDKSLDAKIKNTLNYQEIKSTLLREMDENMLFPFTIKD